jgi:uncharacterized protein YceH (UPF0502 family)
MLLPTVRIFPRTSRRATYYPGRMALSDVELRVLGALAEKERVTPDAYPLTTQALVTACNQKTSREPVTDYHFQEIQEALQKLRDKGLVGTRQEVTDRVPKHAHRLAQALEVNVDELGLLSVLMLRGPQTAGELRTRTDRYRLSLRSLMDYDDCLQALADRRVPLAQNIGRAPGQSQDRWRHTLGADEERLQPRVRRPEPSQATEPQTTPTLAVLLRRLEELEARVTQLEDDRPE